MKDRELKLQAYLDNELGPEEAREVANLIARDSDAAALLHTLRTTRKALVGFEKEIRLPESREFYWSKIRKQIEHLEPQAPAKETPVPWIVRLRRFLVPASAAALLLVSAVVVTRDNSWGNSSVPGETALVDSKAFTYRDYDSGATLVWLSYPADQEGNDSGNDFDTY